MIVVATVTTAAVQRYQAGAARSPVDRISHVATNGADDKGDVPPEATVSGE